MDDFADRLRRFAVAAWAIVGGLLVAVAIGWTAWKVQIIWIPIVFAFAIVYLLNPFVTRLRKMGLPRPLGAVVSYLLFGGLLTALIVLTAPIISQQAEALGAQIPVIANDALDFIERTGMALGFDVQFLTYEDLIAQVTQQPDEQLTEDLQGLAGTVISFLGSLAEAVALLIVTPVIAFYLLIDAPRLSEELQELVPPQYQEELTALGHNLSKALGGFVRGQLFVALIVGLMAGTGLYFLGVELWLILGLIAGLTNLVPFVGPWISGVLATMVALVLGDLGLAVAVALLFLAVQQVDNHIISPLVLRATVKLHPALIILALLVGGSLGGVLGLLLAVPITAFGKVLVSHFWRTRVLGQHWEEASEGYVVEYGPPSPDSLAGRLGRVGRMQVSRPVVRRRRQEPNR